MGGWHQQRDFGNWDAAVNNEGKVGFGSVVRNGKGEIMMARALGYTGFFNVELAEAMAIRSGVVSGHWRWNPTTFRL